MATYTRGRNRNQIRLVITFNWNYFPRGSLTLLSIHGESHMNTYKGGRNRPRKKSSDYVCVILSQWILQLYVSQIKKMSKFQKQPSEVFYRKSCSYKSRNIHRKTPVLGSPFNRLAGLKACNFLKKRLRHRCFPVDFAKFLKTLILMKICEQLLLPFFLLTVNISS